RPVQHGQQELQVVGDHSVAHGSFLLHASRPKHSVAWLSNEPIPLAETQCARLTIATECSREHLRAHSIVLLRARALSRCSFAQIHVKSRDELQFCRRRRRRASKFGGQLFGRLLRQLLVAVPEGETAHLRPLTRSRRLLVLEVHPTGLGMRKCTHPIPSSLADTVAPAPIYRISHR